MAKIKVQQVDVRSALEHITDSNTKHKLENGYQSLVSEVTVNGEVEGTILYIPGISYKTFRAK